MSEQRKPVLTGGCQCGAVRYALYAMPERAGICHCRMCQKAVGGPFASWAPVRGIHLTWKRGTITTFASSSTTRRGFCGKCGTPLTFQYIDSDWIGVTIGSLDRPQDIPPTLSFGIESRLGWLDQIDSLPGSTTESGMSSERNLKYVNYQHPDHDTPPDWTSPDPKSS